MTQIARELRERLKDHGDQTRMARTIGVSQSVISKWMNGDSTPRYDDVVKIADYFHQESLKSHPNLQRESDQHRRAAIREWISLAFPHIAAALQDAPGQWDKAVLSAIENAALPTDRVLFFRDGQLLDESGRRVTVHNGQLVVAERELASVG